MNGLIKIKMSDEGLSSWPTFIHEAINDKNHFALIVESERKLCDSCDYLYFREDILHFHSSELGEMSFNFEDILRYHQRQNYALSKEPLAKALAIKGESKKEIWDTTCGTGKDSLLIHHFGAELTSFERSPAVYLLLKDALRRFPVKFNLVYGDSRLISDLITKKPEVIYYDPMYPIKKKSALARKEMRIFKEMVGNDSDSLEFLEWAMSKASERVVVKRPLESQPIKANPTASYLGKSTRYDMYKIF